MILDIPNGFTAEGSADTIGWTLRHNSGHITVNRQWWSSDPPTKRGTTQTRRVFNYAKQAEVTQYLHCEPAKVEAQTYTSLPDLARALVTLGAILPAEMQTGAEAETMAHLVSEKAEKGCVLGQALLIGYSAFVVTPQPAGDWLLRDMLKRVRRVNKTDVGYFPSLKTAVHTAVTEFFRAAEGTFAYHTVNAEIAGVANFLFREVRLMPETDCSVLAA